MIQLCRISVVALLLSTVTGVAMQRARDARPSLLVFKSPGCPPCVRFDHDYANNPRFRTWLHQNFQLSRRSADYAEKVRQYGIALWPTFIVTDSSGREIRRVTGYTGTASFVQEITGQPARATEPREPPEAPPAPTPPAADPDTRLQAANRKLEQERDGLRNQIYGLRDQLVAAGKDRANVQRQMEELRSRLETLQSPPTASPPAQSQRVPSPNTAAGPAEDISTEITPSADATQSRLPGILRTGVQIAQAAGLSLPAAETVVALTGIGGPAGAAVAVGLMLLRRRRRRKRKAAEQADDFQPRDDAIPRDNSEIEQILSLRQQEQREPIHDAFFGVLFEDEYRTNPDRTVKEAFRDAMDRFNNVAPLSTTETETSSSTTER